MKPDVDDELSPLPPLDGDDGAADDAGVDDAIDLTVPAGSEDPADETASEDLDIGEPTALEDTAVDPNDDAWEGDTGDPDLVGDDGAPLRPGDDEPGIGESDVHLDDDEPDTQERDGDEDGPPDAGDLLLGDELPPMDGDDEGDVDETLLLDAAPAADFDLTERAGLALPLPIQGPAETAVLIDPAGFDAALVVTARDGVRRVDARGNTEPRNLWRELPGAQRFFEGTGASCATLGEGGVLWLATPGGHWLRGEDCGATWEDLGPMVPTVRALSAGADREVSALCADRSELCLMEAADGRHWIARPLPTSAAPYREGTAWLARSGVAVAIGHEREGLVVSRDGGRTLQSIEVASAVAGVFTAEGASTTLVVASYDEASERIRLVRVAADGSIDIAAEVEAPGGDDDEDVARPVVALAWDAPRGLLWLWSGGRLVAWGRRELQ